MSTRSRARGRPHHARRPRGPEGLPAILSVWSVRRAETAPAPFTAAGGLVVHGESTYRGRKVAELWWPLADGQEDDVEELISRELISILVERAEAAIDAPTRAG